MNNILTSLIALVFGLAMTACASTSYDEPVTEAPVAEKATDAPEALEPTTDVVEDVVDDMVEETEEVVDEFVEEDDEPIYK